MKSDTGIPSMVVIIAQLVGIPVNGAPVMSSSGIVSPVRTDGHHVGIGIMATCSSTMAASIPVVTTAVNHYSMIMTHTASCLTKECPSS